MTQLLPNSSEGITNYLDQYSKVNNMIYSLVMSEIIVSFWGFCKVLDSNYSGVTTSFWRNYKFLDQYSKVKIIYCVCVCVCVCERERERERDKSSCHFEDVVIECILCQSNDK